MATGRIGVTPTLGTRWSKAPAGGTTSLSGLDDNSVSLVYSVGYEQVYRNGVLLSRGNDYTATTGNSITLIDATIAGDIIEVFANELVPLTDAISKGQFTAKGALLSATAASTPAVLTVGSNDQVLTADSSTSTGLKWAAPSSGGITLISTTTLSSTNVTLSSIPTTYKDIYLILESFSPQTSSSYLQIRFNNESNTRYQYFGASLGGSTLTNSTSKATQLAIFGTNNQLSGDGENVGLIYIKDYAATTGYKKLVTSQLAAINTSSQDTLSFGFGMYSQFQTAITRIDLFWVGGQSFAGGTAYLYGVK